MRHAMAFLAAALMLVTTCAVAGGTGSRKRDTTNNPKSKGTSTSKSSGTSATKKKPTTTARRRTSSRRRVVRQRMPTAPTPARISEIQTALASQGAYQAEPNGKWDAATVEAMEHFQESHGLPPTGKIDALTLEKLGLGSPIAGQGAPLPEPQDANDPPPATSQAQIP